MTVDQNAQIDDNVYTVNKQGNEMTVDYEVTKRYDQRHGGPFDRGSADSYYHREYNPHYFVGDTYNSRKVEMDEMTAEEITAYTMGYEWNEQYGDKKNYD